MRAASDSLVKQGKFPLDRHKEFVNVTIGDNDTICACHGRLEQMCMSAFPDFPGEGLE